MAYTNFGVNFNYSVFLPASLTSRSSDNKQWHKRGGFDDDEGWQVSMLPPTGCSVLDNGTVFRGMHVMMTQILKRGGPLWFY